MKNISEIKYLADIITESGRNKETINLRLNKAQKAMYRNFNISEENIC